VTDRSGVPPSDRDAYATSYAGPVVPAYALTRGRTRPNGAELPLESLVTATDLALRNQQSLQMELRTIVAMSTRAASVVEIGAALRVPIGVARVLVGDLAAAGYLKVHLTPADRGQAGPGRETLRRLLDGLRPR
jgi:hypothetical protein